MTEITCRKAKEEDLMLYFDWANDIEVRQNAISSELISIENHTAWFYDKINNINTVMYLFENDGVPFGQVRFDIEDNTIFIDYSVTKKFRGQGLGKMMLKMGVKKIVSDNVFYTPPTITGIVKEDNISSIKIFESLGFFKKGTELIKGIKCLIFIAPVNEIRK